MCDISSLRVKSRRAVVNFVKGAILMLLLVTEPVLPACSPFTSVTSLKVIPTEEV